jgi:hypothetical protein
MVWSCEVNGGRHIAQNGNGLGTKRKETCGKTENMDTSARLKIWQDENILSHKGTQDTATLNTIQYTKYW